MALDCHGVRFAVAVEWKLCAVVSEGEHERPGEPVNAPYSLFVELGSVLRWSSRLNFSHWQPNSVCFRK